MIKTNLIFLKIGYGGLQNIDYLPKESYVELNDMNQQWLFEQDIIELKHRVNKTKFDAILLFNSFNLIVIRIEDFSIMNNINLHDYKLKLKSYLFINEELKKKCERKGVIDND